MEQQNLAPMARKPFYKMALMIAAPIMIQQLISTLVSSADTIMLGYVSQAAMSASSLANQLVMVMSMAFYGLVNAASVMAAQYYGKKDFYTIERIMGIAFRLILLISLLFFITSFFFPGLVMRCFTDDEEIINEGIRYLRIVSFSYIFMGFSQVFVSVLRSIEKVVLPTVVYIVSLVVNISINAIFIFGLFGLPKLGLVGVALGTVCARVVEFIICLVYSVLRSEVKFRPQQIFKPAGILMKDFLKISLPSIGNDVIWSAATTIYSVIMGHMGSDAVAANAVAVMMMNIGAVVSRGFANGTTIIVSKALGADLPDHALLYSKRMILMTIACTLLGGMVIVCISPAIISLYKGKLTDTALSLLFGMFLMRAMQLVGEGINTCLICGCFRGGGDARFGMITDAFFMWLVSIPMTLAAAFWLKLPILGVYFVLCIDEFVKMPVAYIHYKRGKWLHNITRSKQELEA